MSGSIRCATIIRAAPVVASLSMLASLPSWSADDAAVSAAREGVARLGKNWNGEVNAATQALYIELQRTADRSGIRATLDVSYGPHELQTMDIFAPEEHPADLAPVVVYLHGGGLVRGDKRLATSDLIYSNIPTFFARHGVVGINANYRLVPEVRWPSGPEDIRGMLTWIRENIEEHGGDPGKVVLMGNSAGARHVASFLFHEPSHLTDGPGVAGALLSSGSYGASGSDAQQTYYGGDQSAQAKLVPLGLVDTYEGPAIPIFMWSAEFDPTSIEAPVAQLYAKLCEKYGDCPRFTQYQGHNHVSHVMSINSADEEVGLAALEFVRSVTR